MYRLRSGWTAATPADNGRFRCMKFKPIEPSLHICNDCKSPPIASPRHAIFYGFS
jgi:hypothetical protein